MRIPAVPVLLLVLALSGCVEEPTATPKASSPRQVGGVGAVGGASFAPLTLEDYVYVAPNVTGAWGAAFWLQSDAIRACDFHLVGTGKPQGGTWDAVAFAAKGWKRPEVLGGVPHSFSRGDGYVAHAGTSGTNQSVKPQAATLRDVEPFEHRRRVDLPTEAMLFIGNTYMAPPAPNRVGMRLTFTCDGPFRLMHAAEGGRLLAYGPEDFDGALIADTIAGFGVQRGASKTLQAHDGFVVVLHEDGNQGNAEYTTARPDGSTQTDTFGNRVAVGGAGKWRFGLNRVSPSPQGEFRLFALDVAIPTLDGG